MVQISVFGAVVTGNTKLNDKTHNSIFLITPMRLKKWRFGARGRAVLIYEQLQNLMNRQAQTLILYD
jgi:hypothetical protein